MAKYYISTGDFRDIVSRNTSGDSVCEDALHEFMGDYAYNGEVDEFDEYIYIDERGFKDYISADKKTTVFETEYMLKKCGYIK